MSDKTKHIIKELIPYVLIVVVVVFIRTFIITPVRVHGSSMDKTLRSGEIMFLYKFTEPERESIVVIDKKVIGSSLIKRVIALPGETIECKDETIYINGKKYKDKYAYGITSDFRKVKLKKNEYFVMGDNRIVSEDSRYFGPVNEKYILGTTNFVLFPFSKAGIVK